MKFPLRITAFRCSIRHEISAYVIEDAMGRGISIPCEADPIRREIAKLWSPEEAKELAQFLARWMTDTYEADKAIRARQLEMQDPHSRAFGR